MALHSMNARVSRDTLCAIYVCFASPTLLCGPPCKPRTRTCFAAATAAAALEAIGERWPTSFIQNLNQRCASPAKKKFTLQICVDVGGTGPFISAHGTRQAGRQAEVGSWVGNPQGTFYYTFVYTILDIYTSSLHVVCKVARCASIRQLAH